MKQNNNSTTYNEIEKQKEFEKGLTSTIFLIALITSILIIEHFDKTKENTSETKNNNEIYQENNTQISEPKFENIKFELENQR